MSSCGSSCDCWHAVFACTTLFDVLRGRGWDYTWIRPASVSLLLGAEFRFAKHIVI